MLAFSFHSRQLYLLKAREKWKGYEIVKYKFTFFNTNPKALTAKTTIFINAVKQVNKLLLYLYNNRIFSGFIEFSTPFITSFGTFYTWCIWVKLVSCQFLLQHVSRLFTTEPGDPATVYFNYGTFSWKNNIKPNSIWL